ncbi:CBO0543 family protein [Ureibacillus sinduriensis]|uniref:ABC transporter permease n=1 Tax=Ureibacillus sinduriensis BLB-1 = JCM 15800 TaxID=1384057 RepID=A0A0A3I6Z6_9BACL|nr:CBO0543 family protein [Ureibacillus sinduriensis]KGR79265.1 hypothetical protein CD33_00535 [Ureibacillus sinduriensis BLB-1 = JCM 15800]
MQSTWQDVLELTEQYKYTKIEYWFSENVYTLSWWILLVSSIVLFLIWIIILDKKRIFEIITYGFFVGTVAIYADVFGVWFGLWHYPITITPMHIPIEIHRLQMPIIYMLIYQYSKTWKTFLNAAAINAIVFTFILEPLLVWLKIYEPSHWKYIYSLIPYFVIAILFKWLITRFKQLDQNYQ